MSDSLWPHELQHTRLPCPSLSPRVCSNSCLLTWWCYLTISSSAAFFSSCPQTLPASGSFSSESALHIRWPKYWSFSISPSNEYSGLIFFRINWYDLLAVQETLKNLLQHHNSTLTSIHDYWKNHSLDYTDLCWPSVYFCLKTLNSKLIPCMRQVLGPGALGRPRGIGWRGRWEVGSGWGTHVNPWLIHVNVWQNPLQCCEVISLQLIKKKKAEQKKYKNKNKNKAHPILFVQVTWDTRLWSREGFCLPPALVKVN